MPPPYAPLASAADVAAARAQRCSHPCDDCYGTRDTVDGKESYSEQAKRVFFSIGESLQPPSCSVSKPKVRFNEAFKNGPSCNGIKDEKRENNCDKLTRSLDNCKGTEGFQRLHNKLEPSGRLVESKHWNIPTVPNKLKYSGKCIEKGFINVSKELQHSPKRVEKCTGSEAFEKDCLGDTDTPRSLPVPWRRSSTAACLARSVRAARVQGEGEGRACRTWYGGYGTLTEEDAYIDRDNCFLKRPSTAASALSSASGRGCKVAESATLLSTRAAPSAAAARRPRALHALLGVRAATAAAVARSRDELRDSPHVPLPLPLPLHNGSPRGLRKCLTTAALTSRRRASPDPEDVILRKCPTAASLGGGVGGGGVEPMRPVNRLRPGSSGLCSRCSSLLSLAAGGSRYSLDAAGAGGFAVVPSPTSSPSSIPSALLCKLCLDTVPTEDTTRIEQCSCAFCTKCMRAYVEFEVGGGAHEVSCPDAACALRGVLQPREVATLAGPGALERLRRFRLNHEVVMDASRAWCPRAGCETVCRVDRDSAHPAHPAHPVHPAHPAPHEVSCPTCEMHFCSECNQEWHEGATCDEAAGAAGADGAAPLLPSGSELIKWCPMCRVPIEKDEGCAQMMCKRCKHVFCWYCLASLDDDFLLRHYDKGPCKNKLGHSRASVIWHRAQVVGIFAGFGLLLLVASPLLLLAAPCIVCCKCRLCSGNGAKNLDDGDEAETMDLERDGEASSPTDDIQRLPDAD